MAALAHASDVSESLKSVTGSGVRRISLSVSGATSQTTSSHVRPDAEQFPSITRLTARHPVTASTFRSKLTCDKFTPF